MFIIKFVLFVIKSNFILLEESYENFRKKALFFMYFYLKEFIKMIKWKLFLFIKVLVNVNVLLYRRVFVNSLLKFFFSNYVED